LYLGTQAPGKLARRDAENGSGEYFGLARGLDTGSEEEVPAPAEGIQKCPCFCWAFGTGSTTLGKICQSGTAVPSRPDDLRVAALRVGGEPTFVSPQINGAVTQPSVDGNRTGSKTSTTAEKKKK
jgi:hypothetical protein